MKNAKDTRCLNYFFNQIHYILMGALRRALFMLWFNDQFQQQIMVQKILTHFKFWEKQDGDLLLNYLALHRPSFWPHEGWKNEIPMISKSWRAKISVLAECLESCTLERLFLIPDSCRQDFRNIRLRKTAALFLLNVFGLCLSSYKKSDFGRALEKKSLSNYSWSTLYFPL